MNNNIIVILLHKPDDRDMVSKLIPYEASSYAFLSYPTKSVLDLAVIIDNLDLIISPDTSIVHMACAFNKPLVAIYRKDMKLFDIWHPISDCNYVVFSDYEDSLKAINVGDIVNKTSRLIKEKYTQIEIQTTFQSRFGPQEWLTPYTDKTLESLPYKGVKNLLVICPGFASDCVETLEEIDIQGRQSFLSNGGKNFDLIPCLNDEKDHIDLFEELVKRYI